MWPDNSISQRFWLADKDKTKNRKVAVVPGTAFVIRKNIFKKVNGFDSHFFLYFEEYDLCKRVFDQNSEIWMLSDAQVIHEWEVTTKKLDKKINLGMIYQSSFRRYLIKHYGIVVGNITHILLNFSKIHLLIIIFLILFLGIIGKQ